MKTRQEPVRRVFWLLGLALALAVSGCSGATGGNNAGSEGATAPAAGAVASVGGGQSVPPQPIDPTVVQDQARWTLPTDPYMGADASSLREQALSVTIYSCMQQAGFTQYRLYWDAAAPHPATEAGDGMSVVFNEEIAAVYGYRLAPDPRYLIEDAVRAGGGSLYDGESPAFHQKQIDCEQEAVASVVGEGPGVLAGGGQDTSLEAEVEDGQQTIESQLNRLHADTSSPELVAAAAAWSGCMAPQGIVDLPSQPWRNGSRELPESLQTAWGWQPNGTPSAEEIAVASADAACRESSGWFGALYEAEWDLRQEFVDTHQADLAPLLTQYSEEEAEYRQVVADAADA